MAQSAAHRSFHDRQTFFSQPDHLLQQTNGSPQAAAAETKIAKLAGYLAA